MRFAHARRTLPSSQKGVTLIIGMIMLVLITMMVTTAFTMSSSNSKSVGNMQFRDEAIAAANKAIEQVIGGVFVTGFTSLPTAASTYYLDVNNDGTNDYTITVAVPACVQSTTVTTAGSTGAGQGSSAGLGGAFSAASTTYNTLWDITATVADNTSMAAVEIHQGVRISLSEAQRAAVCP